MSQSSVYVCTAEKNHTDAIVGSAVSIMEQFLFRNCH